MSETLQNQRQFNSQFEHQEIHRGKDMVKETLMGKSHYSSFRFSINCYYWL